MTTPAAPGAPEGGQPSGDQPAPGAQEQAPQETAARPQQNRPLGKPNQGQQQAPGVPADKPETGNADEPQDVSSLPEWAQKALKKARADAGNARTSAKQQAAQEATTELMAKISKAIGLDTDGEPTVDDLTTQLQERQARIDELEAAQTEHSYRDAVRTAAAQAGADAEALMDSSSFRDAVAAELGDDFTDEELAAAVSKVTREYAKKSRFARQAAPARSGGEITGGPPPPTKQRPRSLGEALGRAYGGR